VTTESLGPAPDGDLVTLDGEEFRLSATWLLGRTVLLVFLRHLG